jgi:hypothetical protein
MNYERGLSALKKLAEGQEWYPEVLLYEARLLENLHDEGLFGSGGPYQNTRNQILYQLNRLAYDHLGSSFNDFCQGNAVRAQHVAPAEASQYAQGTAKDIAARQDAPDRGTRTDVFIGYSQADKKFLEELRRHLRPYVRAELINVWDEAMMQVGAETREEAKRAIQRAKVAILLISADFLASDVIMGEELPLLLVAQRRESLRILPVILAPCDVASTELARFKPANASNKTLSAMTREEREAVWSQLGRLTRDLVPG